MRWRKARRSTNIEDRRGRSRKRMGAGVGGGALIIAIIGALFFGGDPGKIVEMIGGGAGGGQSAGGDYQPSELEQQVADLVSVVVADNEDTWTQIFKQANAQYQPAKLVLFSGQVTSACGSATSASGPFYCPGDYKVYIDLSFIINEMKRMGAQGDFAAAYVVSHEMGHHIQNLIGTAKKVREQQSRMPEIEANKLSVMMELQADCLAGVFTHHTQKRRQFLEEGDIEEAIRAAASVGDDHIQKQATGRVYPDKFTHGTSEQRQQWLALGIKTGDFQQCNTFRGS